MGGNGCAPWAQAGPWDWDPDLPEPGAAQGEGGDPEGGSALYEATGSRPGPQPGARYPANETSKLLKGDARGYVRLHAASRCKPFKNRRISEFRIQSASRASWGRKSAAPQQEQAWHVKPLWVTVLNARTMRSPWPKDVARMRTNTSVFLGSVLQVLVIWRRISAYRMANHKEPPWTNSPPS